MKKISIILILFLILFFTTSCVSYTELNELGIISEMGIDMINDNYNITIKIIDTKEASEENNSNFENLSAYGKTIDEAINNLYLITSKKLYLSHIELLLIDENIASNHIDDIANFFLNDNESRNTFTTVVTKDVKASDILRLADSEQINDLLKTNNEEIGITSIVSFEEFLKNILDINSKAILPTLTIEKDKISIEGYSVFNDKSLYTFLSKEESLIYNILKDKISKAKLNDLNINTTSSKITSKKSNITITINSNLKDKKDIDNYNKLIKDKSLTLIDKYRQIDILDLKNIIKKNNYWYYKENKNNLNIKVKIITNTSWYNKSNLIKGIDINDKK